MSNSFCVAFLFPSTRWQRLLQPHALQSRQSTVELSQPVRVDDVAHGLRLTPPPRTVRRGVGISPHLCSLSLKNAVGNYRGD